MKRYFWIDTSFLYALFVKSDQNHSKAQSLWKPFTAKRCRGVTSNLIIAELGTLLAYHFGHATALKHITMLYESVTIQRVYVDEETASASLRWWRMSHDKKFSTTDCVSFEFLKRLGIKNILSFDHDFEISGFHLIRQAVEL